MKITWVKTLSFRLKDKGRLKFLQSVSKIYTEKGTKAFVASVQNPLKIPELIRSTTNSNISITCRKLGILPGFILWKPRTITKQSRIYIHIPSGLMKVTNSSQNSSNKLALWVESLGFKLLNTLFYYKWASVSSYLKSVLILDICDWLISTLRFFLRYLYYLDGKTQWRISEVLLEINLYSEQKCHPYKYIFERTLHDIFSIEWCLLFLLMFYKHLYKTQYALLCFLVLSRIIAASASNSWVHKLFMPCCKFHHALRCH